MKLGEITHTTYHDEIDDIPQSLLDSLKKRIQACKDIKPCPKCNGTDIQLMSWVVRIIYRCRKCHATFE